MKTLYFAQVSDIHISALGDHDEMLSGRSAGFLVEIFTRFNAMKDLEFVLITGDLFDTAHWQEFDRFQAILQMLEKPYYIIPGNHDRRIEESQVGLTRQEFARRFNPQAEQRRQIQPAQTGYWSIPVAPEVQLIGLDSIRDEDWGGVIDAPQLAWLQAELMAHSGKLIILAVHHPLHQLAPVDELPQWRNFVCANGAEVLALLDQFPQVKVVLTGHHHLTKVDRLNGRLHLACPAVATYPCAYRTLHLTRSAPAGWQLTWQTHPATDAATISQAQEQMRSAWIAAGFENGFIETHIQLARGSKTDRNGNVVLL